MIENYKTLFMTLTWLMFLLVAPGLSDEIDKLFISGNDHYQNGRYEAAREDYIKILNSGYESWEVYYNIGNTYFKEQNIARAILNYERAKRLNPKNEDVNYNLKLANLSAVDRIEQLPEFFLTRWISRTANLISLSALGVLTIIVYIVLILLIIIRKFYRSTKFKRQIIVSIIVIGILFVIFSGLLSYRIIQNETETEAVILNERVDVLSAPDEAGTEVFTLHAGVKVQILDSSLKWFKIRLADGKVGWLKNDVLEII